MTAAYVLADELARAGGRSYADAFHRYESLLRPYIENKEPQKISAARLRQGPPLACLSAIWLLLLP